MNGSKTFVDVFDNFSYVRGASRMGTLVDDTLSTISAFQPAISSTTTKSCKSASSRTLSPQCNRFRLSVSLAPDQDEFEAQDDPSSLGLLKSDDFKSTASVSQRNGDVSYPWDSSFQQEVPRFSEDFGQRDARNNLDFIAIEEAHNQKAHPFIQEEIMDDKGYCETTSWSVSRALEPVVEDSEQIVHLSNNSAVSVSSYFRKHSGPLGEVNGSVLESGLRPAFGATMEDGKKTRRRKHAPGGQGDNRENVSNPRRSDDPTKGMEGCARGDAELSDTFESKASRKGSRNSHERGNQSTKSKSKQMGETERAAGGQEASLISYPCRQETSVTSGRSSLGPHERSSFWSLQRIQTVVAEASVSGNASLLSKQILSMYDMEKRKKRGTEKQRKHSSKEAVSLPKNDERISEKPASVPARRPEKNGSTAPPNVQPLVELPSAITVSGNTPVDSITVEMKIGNTVYKGVLCPQITAPADRTNS